MMEPMDDRRYRSAWLGPALRRPVRRVVSLVPSLTDAVFALGAGEILVGRTDFCVRPRGEVEGVPAVGGTKNPDVARVLALAPDLVLANREENTRRRVERIAATVPVLLTDPASPHDVPPLWRELGDALDRAGGAVELAAECERTLDDAAAASSRSGVRPRFLYWVWRDPWMAAGHGTYISALLVAAGWCNALPAEKTRYPKVDPAEAAELAADALLLPSEPYAFRVPEDADALWTAAGAAGSRPPALAVDGERLSWYPSLTAAGLRHAAALRRALLRTGPASGVSGPASPT